MTALFHQDVIVATLGSGSRGNCTYIGDGRRGVLVDCGLSTRQIFRRLEAVGLGDTTIEAVLITHEHSDHVGACRVLSRRTTALTGRPVPFYMTRGTAAALDERCRPERIERVRAGHPVQLGGWLAEPYTVPHDTHDPVAWAVEIGGLRVGVVTDLGRPTRLVEQQLSRMDVAVVEFNHDLRMLLEGSYPWSLKQRVRGPHGHLSNEQAAGLVTRGASGRLRHLVLAHLSEENNLPELAHEAAERALHAAGLGGVRVEVAAQDSPLDPRRVRAPLDPAAPAPRRRASSRREEPRPDDSALQVSLFG